MKILFVSTIISTVNAFLIPHIEMLQEQGYIVEIATNTLIGNKDKVEEIGIKVHHIPFQRSPFSKDNFVALNKMKTLVLRERYNIVHTHTPIASFLTRLACRNIKELKMLYTAHGFHFFKGAPKINWLIYYPIEKIAARWTDAIITMNNEDYEITKRFKYRRLKSVHKVNGVGVNLDRFSPKTMERKEELRCQYNYTKNDFILFYAAELNKNKHQDFLIKTIEELKERIPNIKLILAGKGGLLEEYENLAGSLGVAEHIEFLGIRKDIPKLLAISDIVVASSRREGLPVNIMEAMATGLPLVVTDVRGHSDLVESGINGFIVDVNDVKEFANSIESLWNSKKLRSQIGEKGLELVQQYSIENVLVQMEEIYSEQLGGE